jgi:hypothetical protein
MSGSEMSVSDATVISAFRQAATCLQMEDLVASFR